MAQASHSIRKATELDAAVVGDLLFDFNTEFATPTPSGTEFAARFQHLLGRQDVLVLIAEESATAVGFAYLTFRPTPYGDGPLAQLEELYVRPALRGGGIGSALLVAALTDASRRGAVEMDINVDEDDVETRRFYERHGFINVEPGSDYRMLCYIQEL